MAESQAQSDSFFEGHAADRQCFCAKKLDEAGPAGVGPDVGVEQFAERVFVFESDLALADPVKDRIAPEPMGEKSAVALGELAGEIEFTLLDDFLGGVGQGKHFFGFTHDSIQVSGRLGGGAHKQGWELVRFTSWNFDVPLI